MKKLSMLLAVFAFLVAALPAIAQNGAEVEKGTAWLSEYNPCCDNWVEFEVTYHRVANNNGWHMTFKGNAVADDGTKYTIKEVYNYTWHWSENGADGATATAWLKFGAIGNDCGFTVIMKYHYTYNAKGDLVVDRYESSFVCDNGTIIE